MDYEAGVRIQQKRIGYGHTGKKMGTEYWEN